MQTLTLTKLEAIAARANEAHRRVTATTETTLSLARQAGEILLEAKAEVKHGEWQAWLKANFEGGVRTAQNYMRVHERWDYIAANTQHVSHLALRAALDSIAEHGPSEDMRDLHEAVRTVSTDVLKRLSKSGESLQSIKHKAEVIAETILTGAVNTPSGEQVPATNLIASDVLERERQALLRQRDHIDEKLKRIWMFEEQRDHLKELARQADLDAQEGYTRRWKDLL